MSDENIVPSREKWHRQIDRRQWVLVGDWQGGTLNLEVHPRRTMIMHERELDGKLKHHTVAGYFGDDAYKLAMVAAKNHVKLGKKAKSKSKKAKGEGK